MKISKRNIRKLRKQISLKRFIEDIKTKIYLPYSNFGGGELIFVKIKKEEIK